MERTQLNVRLRADIVKLLKTVCKSLDLAESDAVALGIRLLAKREGIVADSAPQKTLKNPK